MGSIVFDEEKYKKFLKDAITGNYNEDYFAKLQLDVIKEKEDYALSQEDEEKLFQTVGRYLRDPRSFGRYSIDILNLEKLAYIPPSTPVKRLTDLAQIICDKVFNYNSDNNDVNQNQDSDDDDGDDNAGDEPILRFTEFCKGFAFLKASKSGEDIREVITFEEVLIDLFLEKLHFRFSFKQRLQDLAKNYKGPDDKKQKWILKHSEEYNSNKRQADLGSIDFLGEMYTLYPEIVYRVVELLLSINEQQAKQYLMSLLERIQDKHLEDEYWFGRKCTNISAMKKNYFESKRRKTSLFQVSDFNFHTEKKDLTNVFENINRLLDRNNISSDCKSLLHYILEDGFLKDNTPQDYVRYSIKHSLKWFPKEINKRFLKPFILRDYAKGEKALFGFGNLF